MVVPGSGAWERCLGAVSGRLGRKGCGGRLGRKEGRLARQVGERGDRLGSEAAEVGRLGGWGWGVEQEAKAKS